MDTVEALSAPCGRYGSQWVISGNDLTGVMTGGSVKKKVFPLTPGLDPAQPAGMPNKVVKAQITARTPNRKAFVPGERIAGTFPRTRMATTHCRA